MTEYKHEPNFSFTLDGVLYNLDELNKNELSLLHLKLNMYQMSVENLGGELSDLSNIYIGGNSLMDVITEVRIRLIQGVHE